MRTLPTTEHIQIGLPPSRMASRYGRPSTSIVAMPGCQTSLTVAMRLVFSTVTAPQGFAKFARRGSMALFASALRMKGSMLPVRPGAPSG